MLNGKLVMIVDDDEDLAQSLERRCRGLGLRVQIAHNGMDALEQIELREPDLVLLDVNMPSGSGLAVCEMIGGDPCLSGLPVIIMTGSEDEETVRRCRSLRAQYLVKGSRFWSRLQPLLMNCLGLDPHASSGAALALPPPILTHPAHLPRDRAAEPERTTGATSVLAADAGSLIVDRASIDEFFDALGSYEPVGETAPGLSGYPRVLCIDDDADLAHSIKLRLGQHGVEVFRAANGLKGYCDAFTLNNVQAIILDFSMPDGNGDYVLRRLKDNPVTQHIPVIVVTGRKEPELRRAMLELGAALFLNKPLDWKALLTELGRHMRLETRHPARLVGGLPRFSVTPAEVR